jgi:hypothetical protein
MFFITSVAGIPWVESSADVDICWFIPTLHVRRKFFDRGLSLGVSNLLRCFVRILALSGGSFGINFGLRILDSTHGGRAVCSTLRKHDMPCSERRVVPLLVHCLCSLTE